MKIVVIDGHAIFRKSFTFLDVQISKLNGYCNAEPML
jgi:hypothetical protein